MGKQNLSEHVSPDAADIRTCCVGRPINALSGDVIHALSDSCSLNAASTAHSRDVSRVKLGRNEYYGKPELYQNRWKAQFIAKFPNSKLARNLF